MSPSGQLPHSKVWKMLDKCAPGWTKQKQQHHYRINYGDRSMWDFPFGKRSDKTTVVQVHFVRKLATALGIYDCAEKVLPQIRRKKNQTEL
jgi:hypothetical protein